MAIIGYSLNNMKALVRQINDDAGKTCCAFCDDIEASKQLNKKLKEDES